MGTASIYSNGTRTVAIQNTPGYDLENPLTFWFAVVPAHDIVHEKLVRKAA